MTSGTSLIYQLLDRDAIYDTLFDSLSPGSIFSLGQINKLSHSAVNDYKYRSWNIDKHLRRYFTDPIGFRALQAQTSTIISGSSALQFLDRTYYPNSNLDLYVEIRNARKLCSWIVENGGKDYEFQPSAAQQRASYDNFQDVLENFKSHAYHIDPDKSATCSYIRTSKSSILNFHTSAHAESKPMLIQVTVSQDSPISSVLDSHSTAVMNVLTYYAAYSLFPIETFEKRRMMPFLEHQITPTDAITKYVDRGWTLIRTADFIYTWPDARDSEFRRGKRRIGDSSTWIIPFDITGVRERLSTAEELSLPIPLQRDPISANSFSITSDTDAREMRTEFDLVDPSFFRNSYTMNLEFSVKIALLFNTAHKTIENIPSLTVSERNDRVFSIFQDICWKYCSCSILEYCMDYKPENILLEYPELEECRAFLLLKPLASLLLHVDEEG